MYTNSLLAALNGREAFYGQENGISISIASDVMRTTDESVATPRSLVEMDDGSGSDGPPEEKKIEGQVEGAKARVNI